MLLGLFLLLPEVFFSFSFPMKTVPYYLQFISSYILHSIAFLLLTTYFFPELKLLFEKISYASYSVFTIARDAFQLFYFFYASDDYENRIIYSLF